MIIRTRGPVRTAEKGRGAGRFTRLRSSTLGKGYGQEDIQAVIEGKTTPQERRKVNLIMDIQSRMKTGKGPAYERWAKVFNLKQMAAALQYLHENGLLEYADLEQKAAKLTGSTGKPKRLCRKL